MSQNRFYKEKPKLLQWFLNADSYWSVKQCFTWHRCKTFQIWFPITKIELFWIDSNLFDTNTFAHLHFKLITVKMLSIYLLRVDWSSDPVRIIVFILLSSPLSTDSNRMETFFKWGTYKLFLIQMRSTVNDMRRYEYLRIRNFFWRHFLLSIEFTQSCASINLPRIINVMLKIWDLILGSGGIIFNRTSNGTSECIDFIELTRDFH